MWRSTSSERFRPQESLAFVNIVTGNVNLRLFVIKCGPKELGQLASQLRCEVCVVLSFLRCCGRTKICVALGEFLLRTVGDVAAEFGVKGRIIISECCTGGADVSARV